ncbi:MAG TPA: HlyD family efflux transporter periplasmic adaptor subunit [Bryobacteraceae bacterium]|jgi:HlyD family secretion protein|nr:HlyD family efflux transporter periplasmic adaptor subunit [Bryobacteraceae bacterium]
MDIPRGKEVARRRTIRRIVTVALSVAALGGVTFALARLKPAAPSVDRGSVWIDTVKRGPMERQVRGLGRLTPEAIYFIAAAVDCRVERIVRRPGLDPVKANDVLMVLSNPDLELAAETAAWQVKQDEATLANLKVTLQSAKLDQQAQLAELESEYTQAKLTADRDLELTRLNLESDLTSKLSVDKADELSRRVALQKQRLEIADASIKAQIDQQNVVVESARAAYDLKRKQVDNLTIRAGINGVLQENGNAGVDVEEGQRVTSGTILAKVADPTRLKAELKIAETQMKDVRVGMDASIDTRNGLIPGHVIRIDPAAQNGTVTVDVSLDGPLPEGARPELSVDGTIELEHLSNILYVGRPVSGQPDSTIGLFKLDPDDKGATRVNVKLGRSSVNTIEVLGGLDVGDQVILSDMSQWDSQPRIRLN